MTDTSTFRADVTEEMRLQLRSRLDGVTWTQIEYSRSLHTIFASAHVLLLGLPDRWEYVWVPSLGLWMRTDAITYLSAR